MKTFKWSVPQPKHRWPPDGERLQIPDIQGRTRHPFWRASLALVGAAWLLLFMMAGGGAGLLLLLSPLVLWPMLLTLLLGLAASSRASLLTLLIANFLYFGFFLRAFLALAFQQQQDALEGVVFFLLGRASLPMMLPAWVIAMLLRRRGSVKTGTADMDGRNEPHA